MSSGRLSQLTRHQSQQVILKHTEGSQTFKSFTGREYVGPKLSSIPSSSVLNDSKKSKGLPCFLGSDGEWYDKNYVLLSKEEVKKASSDPNSQITPDSIKKMPKPDEFADFFQYEQALLDWKMDVQASIGAVKLPDVIGRSYYRPRFTIGEEHSGQTNPSGFHGMDESSKQETKLNTPEEVYNYLKQHPKMHQQRSQIVKLLERRKTNIFADLQLADMYGLEKDSWDSFLVPEEPDPSYYDSFEQYEEAMLRWSILCSKSWSYSSFPCHANQFSTLIPIHLPEVEEQSENKEQTLEDETDSEDTLTAQLKSHILFRSFLPWQNKKQGSQPKIISFEWPSESPNLLSQQSPETKQKLEKFIESLLEKAESNKKELKTSYVKPIIPIIHGTLPQPKSTSSSEPASNYQRFMPLRRLELTSAQLQQSFDCAKEVNGVQVEFNAPSQDLDIAADLTSLKNADPKFSAQIEHSILFTRFEKRHNELYSWNFPMTTPQEISKQRSAMESILSTTNPEKWTIDQIIPIFSVPMYVDKFQDFLKDAALPDVVGLSYLKAFVNVLQPENFEKILNLFYLHSDVLTHAKISTFVYEVLQSSKAKLLLESYLDVKKLNVSCLGLIAYSMNYFSTVPVDIYPYGITIQQLISRSLGKPAEAICKLAIGNYYLRFINRVVDKQQFYFVSIREYLPLCTKSLMTQLISLLKENSSKFLTTTIWSGISHRSKKISSLFLVILTSMLKFSDFPGVTELFKTDTASLVQNVKNLCKSKFSHVQFAARRLFSILQSESWLEFAYSYYRSSGDMIFEDLTSPLNSLSQYGLMPSLVLEMCIQGLKKVTVQSMPNLGFLLDELFFHKIFKFISSNITQLDDRAEGLSRLMAQLADTYTTLGQVVPLQTAPDRKKGNLRLSISIQDIQQLLSTIANATRSDKNSEKTFLIKKNLLVCVRHLAKPTAMFELFMKESSFLTHLQNFCRSPELEFNHEAWKLVYQMIYYHHNVLDWLVEEKHLANFLDLLGPNSHPNVLLSGLLYITKLFSLNLLNEKRQVEGRRSRREETKEGREKSFEKDMKSLNSFFVKRGLFVRVNMIYMKINSPNCAGQPFLELARLFNVIVTNSQNSKLWKDSSKKAEYKAGLMKLSNYFNANADPVSSPLVSPNLSVQRRESKVEEKMPTPSGTISSGSVSSPKLTTSEKIGETKEKISQFLSKFKTSMDK